MCKWHGGHSLGGSKPGQTTVAASAAYRRKLELRHALGLPWYGGRPVGRGKALSQASEGERVADALIEALPLADLPDEAKGPPELLSEGMRAGLLLARDICRQARENPDDIKLRRLGSDTGAWLCRLGIRVAEQGFRHQQNDTLGKLLEALQAERERGSKKPVDG